MKILGIVLMVAGFLGQQVLGPIGGLMIVIGVLMLIVGLVRRGGERGASIPALSGFVFSFHHCGTGIGLDPDRRMVKLIEGKKEKEYPFSDVREWETNLASGGSVVHLSGGLAGGLMAGAHNAGVAARNRRESGLFVKVRDIDNPVWRIDMLRKADQERWMEILRQKINESER